MPAEWTFRMDEGRLMVEHHTRPRFTGEIMSDETAPLSGFEIALPDSEQVVTNIEWTDPPKFDPNDLIASLTAALDEWR